MIDVQEFENYRGFIGVSPVDPSRDLYLLMHATLERYVGQESLGILGQRYEGVLNEEQTIVFVDNQCLFDDVERSRRLFDGTYPGIRGVVITEEANPQPKDITYREVVDIIKEYYPAESYVLGGQEIVGCFYGLLNACAELENSEVDLKLVGRLGLFQDEDEVFEGDELSYSEKKEVYDKAKLLDVRIGDEDWVQKVLEESRVRNIDETLTYYSDLDSALVKTIRSVQKKGF